MTCLCMSEVALCPIKFSRVSRRLRLKKSGIIQLLTNKNLVAVLACTQLSLGVTALSYEIKLYNTLKQYVWEKAKHVLRSCHSPNNL